MKTTVGDSCRGRKAISLELPSVFSYWLSEADIPTQSVCLKERNQIYDPIVVRMAAAVSFQSYCLKAASRMKSVMTSDPWEPEVQVGVPSKQNFIFRVMAQTMLIDKRDAGNALVEQNCFNYFLSMQ